MVPYFLRIPLALAATGAFARFLDSGGAINWLMAAVLLSLALLVHLTAVDGGVASRGGRIYRGGRWRRAVPDKLRTEALPAPARRKLVDRDPRPGDQRVLVAAGNLAVGNKRGK